ncbi:hypothetical protein [Blastococcus sp. TF02A-35]|uniref:hypothetical protein n=1 Tax=Blastococcus sp. TF02A-35 TaxID=2559612 RepID=UPI0010734EF2|nr:hypothetical protein [Blastococcus sp. TF02A_35]TFV53811.1 hypothetical protein E4P43_00745 [Blastococcus sp. TF02A_35]
MHPNLHLRLPHLPPAALLLSVVYAAAIAVALANPGRPTVAGVVVLAGLTARWALRHRRRAAVVVPLAVVPDALTPETAAPAPAAAA